LATDKDIPHIMRIAKESIALMRAEGNPQWDETYPAQQDFLRDIKQHSLYVYCAENDPCAFICLDGNEPSAYRGLPWRGEMPALILHRFAVSPASRGNGIGKAMLDFTKIHARQKGLHSIRTDTFSGNANMNHLFRRNGFVKTGEIHLRKIERPFYCYEYLLGE
jgi:GNAT superfamily N-acetyltransferase